MRRKMTPEEWWVKNRHRYWENYWALEALIDRMENRSEPAYKEALDGLYRTADMLRGTLERLVPPPGLEPGRR